MKKERERLRERGTKNEEEKKETSSRMYIDLSPFSAT